MADADTTPAHLTPTVTSRGFRHLPSIQGRGGFGAVRVYESSNAEEPCLWLEVDQLSRPPAIVQLTAESAWQLKEQLEWLLEHHYQGDARPEEARHG